MDEEELRKQREEVTAIVKMRVAGTASGTQVRAGAWAGLGWWLALLPDLSQALSLLQHAGDFICTVYLEEKRVETEQHVKVRLLNQAGPGAGADGHIEEYDGPQRHPSLHLGAQGIQ